MMSKHKHGRQAASHARMARKKRRARYEKKVN